MPFELLLKFNFSELQWSTPVLKAVNQLTYYNSIERHGLFYEIKKVESRMSAMKVIPFKLEMWRISTWEANVNKNLLFFFLLLLIYLTWQFDISFFLVVYFFPLLQVNGPRYYAPPEDTVDELWFPAWNYIETFSLRIAGKKVFLLKWQF